MKAYLLIFILVPILSYSQSTDDRIKEIRSLYKDVESRLANCIKIPITMFYDEDYITSGSSEMEGYYDTTSRELIKIVEHTYYDWAESEVSFYFNKGDLFFVYDRGNTPGEMYTAEELGMTEQELWESGGEAKSLEYYENRYYFEGRTCIQHKSKNKEILIDDDPDLSEVPNEKMDATEVGIIDINKHGYKLFREFEKQAGIKKK